MKSYHDDVAKICFLLNTTYLPSLKLVSLTQMLYGETPCNPLTTIIDLEAFGQLGNSVEGLLTVVDSTYAPPCIQRPHQYGIDVVIHSG